MGICSDTLLDEVRALVGRHPEELTVRTFVKPSVSTSADTLSHPFHSGLFRADGSDESW